MLFRSVAMSTEQAEAAANEAYDFSEASFSNALNTAEGQVRKGAHAPAEAPPPGFDAKDPKDADSKDAADAKDAKGAADAKKDFQLTRALDVLRYGSVAATPKLPTVKPKIARFQAPPAKGDVPAGGAAAPAAPPKPVTSGAH